MKSALARAMTLGMVLLPASTLADGTNPQDTPIGAIKALQAAVRRGDESAILALTTARTERQRRDFREYAGGWARSVSFFKLLGDRFGEGEAEEVFTGVALMFPTSWIDLDHAQVEVDGDKAVVTAWRKKQTILREGGRWKVFFADWDEEELAEIETKFLPTARGLRAILPDIEAGRFRALGDVAEELERRSIGGDKPDPAATPVGAIRSLEKAIQAGDEKAILDLTTAGTDRQRQALREQARGWARSAAFFEALEARFGRDQVNHSGILLGVASHYPSSWLDLDHARVEVRDDQAVVSSGVRRQVVAREGGRWKVSFSDWDEETLARKERLAGPTAEAMKRLTPEIREGKLRGMDEFEAEFNRIVEEQVKRNAEEKAKEKNEGRRDPRPPGEPGR
jgi:hypothetical protein